MYVQFFLKCSICKFADPFSVLKSYLLPQTEMWRNVMPLIFFQWDDENVTAAGLLVYSCLIPLPAPGFRLLFGIINMQKAHRLPVVSDSRRHLLIKVWTLRSWKWFFFNILSRSSLCFQTNAISSAKSQGIKKHTNALLSCRDDISYILPSFCFRQYHGGLLHCDWGSILQSVTTFAWTHSNYSSGWMMRRAQRFLKVLRPLMCLCNTVCLLHNGLNVVSVVEWI